MTNETMVKLPVPHDPYVMTIDDNLDACMCDGIIEVFRLSDEAGHVRRGTTADGVNESVKSSRDVNVADMQFNGPTERIRTACVSLVQKMRERLFHALSVYFDHLNERGKTIAADAFWTHGVRDIMYNVQMYTSGTGFYRPHQDFMVYDVPRHQDGDDAERQRKARVLTYLWYLNDVEEGGETAMFVDGVVKINDPCLIKPRKGRLLLFPATWTYVHAGLMPIKGDKYICTGWLME